ncbi:MAG TPA: DUF4440 domain-containing protein [Holophagaceae bacterium]|jgi:hypothetical protein|nr:DUF4440 domain-containing protein [Holophagaceae bacterium]
MRALLPALLCAICAGQAPADVANAELAFAKLASEKGISASFLANFAEGSLILNPEPTDARAHYAKENDPASLSWRPTWVGLSASGDLAYSTGPWEYRATKDAAPIVQGHFLSLWAKQADGTWKVALDCGVAHAARPEPATWSSFLPPAPPPASGDGATAVKAADQRFTDGRNLAQALAFGATVYRRGAAPLEGRAAVRDKLADEPTRRFEPQGAVASKAQDLAYTWGLATATDGGQVSYLHVWVRPGGSWQLLYDLELPLPRKP